MNPTTSTHIRAFSTQLVQSSTRELVGRFVPYDLATDVLDELPGGGIDVYKEGFRRGSFATQANSKEPGVLRRISLQHAHEGGLGYLGPVTELRDESDGLWGTVAVLRSKASDVEDLLASGVSELSVEFRLPAQGQNTVEEGGVRWRTKAHLDSVALEARGAYRGAEVMAYRAEMDAVAAQEAEARAAAESAQAEVQADLDAAVERRRRWEELTGDRLTATVARQVEFETRYGVHPSR
jgi:HK97 family phage prohead protease